MTSSPTPWMINPPPPSAPHWARVRLPALPPPTRLHRPNSPPTPFRLGRPRNNPLVPPARTKAPATEDPRAKTKIHLARNRIVRPNNNYAARKISPNAAAEASRASGPLNPNATNPSAPRNNSHRSQTSAERRNLFLQSPLHRRPRLLILSPPPHRLPSKHRVFPHPTPRRSLPFRRPRPRRHPPLNRRLVLPMLRPNQANKRRGTREASSSIHEGIPHTMMPVGRSTTPATLSNVGKIRTSSFKCQTSFLPVLPPLPLPL